MALKIIGAGGPRTGTASLKEALERLGFGKCYLMEWLFNHPEQLKYWHELYATGTTDFDSLFDGFTSTVDFPGYINYKAIFKKYPDAKVILSLAFVAVLHQLNMLSVSSIAPLKDNPNNSPKN